ncbi:hypothetical protein C7M84_016432, partial [Penaeus vannamei]
VVSGGRGVTRMRDGHATNVKMHHCPYCPYTTRKKTHMTSHIRVHTREKPFPCPYCSLRFTQKGNLRTHMHTHMNKDIFTFPKL